MIYFIAAGKGSRMKSDIPKALHKINNKSALVRNIEKMKDYRVVINNNDKDIFKKYIPEEKLISICSGLGSGHAIMQLELEDDDIIIWGDTLILENDIIDELENVKSDSPLIVPLKSVHNPYVNFKIDSKFNIEEVMFSKYGEISAEGFQDCCIFKVKKSLKNYLLYFHKAVWKSRYITESNEFEFLYIIHYLFNINNPAYGYMTENDSNIVSYNTKKELKEIERSL